MVSLQDILRGGLVPGVAVAAVLLVASWLARRNLLRRDATEGVSGLRRDDAVTEQTLRRDAAATGAGTGWDLLWPLAAGGGYVLGHSLQQGVRWLRPLVDRDWLPWIAIAAALTAALLLWPRLARATAAGWPTALLAAAGLYLVERPKIAHAWGAAESVAWVLLPAVTLAVAWRLLVRNTAGTDKTAASPAFVWETTVAWLLVAAAAGPALLLSGTQRYAEMVGTILFVALAAVAVAVARRAGRLLPATLAALLIPLGMILVAGHLYASLTMTNLLLLAAALLLAVAPLPWQANLAPPWRWIMRLTAVAIPLSISLTTAGIKFAKATAA